MHRAKSGLNVAEFLRNSKVFGSLPGDAIASLAKNALVERYAVRTLIHPAGQGVQRLWLVVAGHVELISQLAGGDEVELSDVMPGHGIPWLACIGSSVPVYDLWSSPHACLIALPALQVRALCEQHPAIYQRILVEVGERMSYLLEWTTQSVLLKPEQRLAKLLHVLARSRGLDGVSAILPLTQSRLARLAGCSRQSLSVLLKALKERGLVTGAYGELRIADIHDLQSFIDAGPPNT